MNGANASPKAGKSGEGVPLGAVEDFPPGSVTIVAVGKFGVGVYNLDGEFVAVLNYCIHRGAPACKGPVSGAAVAGPEDYSVDWTRAGEVLRCPWHGWEFDLRSGRSIAFPEKKLRTYPVSVRDGVVTLEGL